MLQPKVPKGEKDDSSGGTNLVAALKRLNCTEDQEFLEIEGEFQDYTKVMKINIRDNALGFENFLRQ